MEAKITLAKEIIYIDQDLGLRKAAQMSSSSVL